MTKIVTMGEIMLKLSIPNDEEFIQADEFDINYGGGEANIVVPLADCGHEAKFVTTVPANPTGECAVAVLRRCNVDAKHTARSGERLGIYFLETDSAMRAPNVVCGRTHNSISTVTAGRFSFDEIFIDADWFRFTEVAPAVGDAIIEFTEAALMATKAHNVTVSVDLNFRRKLWSSKKVQKVMTNLMQYIDVYISNEEDAEKILGSKSDNTDVTSGELELVGYVDTFDQMADKFDSKYIISSLREDHSVSGNDWSARIMDEKTRGSYYSREYRITPIIDRIGSGDSFTADLIYDLVDGRDMKAALEYTAAASALKHTILGDFNLVTRADVENLIDGNDSGRVQG